MKLGELMHQLAVECGADPATILEADIGARAMTPAGSAELDLSPDEEVFCRDLFRQYFQDPAFRKQCDRRTDAVQESN